MANLVFGCVSGALFPIKVFRPLLLVSSSTSTRERNIRRQSANGRGFATDEATTTTAVDPSEDIDPKQNKSGLKPWVRQRMIAMIREDDVNCSPSPPPAPLFDYQTTLRARRRLYARYGRASGVDPRIAWPSANELQRAIDMERELETDLRTMLDEIERRKCEQETRTKERQAHVEAQMAKLDGWMRDVQARKDKKVAEALALREKKERLIEEVRQYFGYKLSPKDPKFQEVIEKKEREEKKAEKEARKKEKVSREMARLAALAQQQQKQQETVGRQIGTDDTKKPADSSAMETR